MLGRRFPALACSDPVADHRQVPLSGFRGVLLTQRSCRGIAWVGKRLPALLHAVSVNHSELFDTNEHFASNFQQRWYGILVRRGNCLGDIGDRPGVRSDVFAGDAVATSGGRHEFAVAIYQIDG